MTDHAAGTAELEQVAPGMLALVQDPARSFDLKDLIAKLAAPAAPLPAGSPAPKPAPAPDMSPALLAALKRLHEVYGKVAPSEARKLEKTEVERLTEENWVIAQISTALGNRETQIDEAMRHHMDAVAREQGITGPLIPSGKAKGHVLAAKPGVPFRVEVEGFEDDWRQQLTSGEADLSPALLTEKVNSGEITRAEYLALTEPPSTRLLTSVRISMFLRKHPARGLNILRMITTRKPDGASLVSPKKKQ